MLGSSLPFLVLFLLSLLTVLATTPLASKIAWKLGAVDYPSKRRINTKPIPRMGGIAVFLALIVALVVQHIGSTYFGWPIALVPDPHHADLRYWTIVVGFVIIFLTGAIDDIGQLSPIQKLAGQVLAAGVAVAGGLTVGVIVNPFTDGPLDLGILSYPITIVYLVAYANIINLIDGLDGLASGIAGIAAITMSVLSAMAGHTDATMLAVTIAGACLGFLRYNFNPASIFLGDSGSLLLGYALGVISLLSVTRIAGLTTIIVPLIIAGIPIIDTFSAIVRRKRAHVSIGQADRGHIHHRLIDEGFSQKQAVLVMYAWTALLCLGTFVMTQVDVWPRIAIFVLLLIVSLLFARKLHLFRPVLLHHTNPDTGDDELIGPTDPAFDEEQERFDETHHLLD